MLYTINPAKPVAFNHKAISNLFDSGGFLMADIKHDSVRCHMLITRNVDGEVTLTCYSRTDKVLPALATLQESFDASNLSCFLDESLYPEGIVLDGEMMVKGVDFNTGSGMIRRKTPLQPSQLVFMLYGVLPLSHFKDGTKGESFPVSTCVMQEQLRVVTMQVRELLPEMDWQQTLSYEVYNMEGVEEVYKQVRDAGHEGLVLKDAMAPWHRGKKSGWWKMKASDTVDGQVVGLLFGTEGKANEGKVIGFEVLLENGVVVNVTGITQVQMTEFTEKTRDDSDYYNGHYIEVNYMESTPDGSLRHPSFNKWRGTETDPTFKS